MDALYQEQMLALAKTARATPPLPSWTHSATVTNPTCGDRVEVRIELDADSKIAAVSATVRGCALCEAGAGLLLAVLPHMRQTQLSPLRDSIANWIAGSDQSLPDGTAETLKIFMPVRDIRNRHKCVLLSFEATVQATA